MKKLCLLLAGGLLIASAALAGEKIPVQVKQLPDAAKGFVRDYFNNIEVASASMETGTDKNYEVTLVDGSQLEFDAHGQWREIDTPNSVVPAKLVPPQIAQFVAKNHPGQSIIGLERSRQGWEAALENGYELQFNRKFRLMELDK